jgi:hypothetical protein
VSIDYVAAFEAISSQVRLSCPGLNALSHMPDNPPIPCFALGETNTDPNVVFGKIERASVYAYLLTARGTDSSGQQALMRLLNRDPAAGVESIWNAVEALKTSRANGTLNYIKVGQLQFGQQYLFGPNWYYGARVTLEVAG